MNTRPRQIEKQRKGWRRASWLAWSHSGMMIYGYWANPARGMGYTDPSGGVDFGFEMKAAAPLRKALERTGSESRIETIETDGWTVT